MEVLLQCKNIDVNARDKMVSLMKDHSDRDKLRMLLERKVTLSSDTPLHLARQQRVDVQVLMALLSVQSINVNATYANSRTLFDLCQTDSQKWFEDVC